MKPAAIPFVLVLPLTLALLSPDSLAQGSDSCAGAQGIVGSGPHAFDLSAATTTPADGQNGCFAWSSSAIPTDVWFTWTAPSSSTFIVTSCQQTTVDTKIAVYPTTGCPPGAPIGCDDDNCNFQGFGTQAVAFFSATAAQTYLIQVGTGPFGSPGTGTFRILPAAGGALDDCGFPATISGTGMFGFDNNLATTGTQGQSNPFCPPPSNASNDIWYSWTSPVTGMAQLDTCGQTSTDTKVGAYSGTGCPAGTSLACGDDECGLTSLIQWPVTSGVSYTLQIGGTNGFSQSVGTFRIEITPVPTNDSCNTPATLPPGPGGASYDNTIATTGPQVGSPCGVVEKDLWWNWTATVNGTATIETCGTTAANTKIAAYAGGGCPGGAGIACDDDGCGQQSTVSISVTPGAVFRIQVGSSPGFAGGPAAFIITETPLGGGPMTPMCFPGTGGVISCPCGQPANPSGGCANFGSGSTSGGVLNATGSPSVSNDTLQIVTTNQRTQPPTGILNVFFSYKPGTATPTNGIPSGAGVRCIGSGGTLRRLYTGQAIGGSLSKPGMGDLSVSQRSAQFAGHAIAPPETRFYFNVYRDGQASGPCGSSSVSTNLTNMGSVDWGP